MTPGSPAAPRGVLAGRSELVVVGFLLVVAGVVLRDAIGLSRATPGGNAALGPAALPFLVAAGLAVCAVVLAVDVLRGGRGEADGGEDVDLTHRSDWRTVLLLVGVFLAGAALVDRAGWVISGTVLFAGCTYALGSRHLVRDLAVAVTLSLLTFYGFAIGLGVNLPSGVLTGIL